MSAYEFDLRRNSATHHARVAEIRLDLAADAPSMRVAFEERTGSTWESATEEWQPLETAHPAVNPVFNQSAVVAACQALGINASRFFSDLNKLAEKLAQQRWGN
jgi:hypothetical protein